ncbi:envelope stress response membrane protein PspB [Glacieibacterium sp.]|uniref:envelope stress response membrane protein PspB n=1 Tax=Glacieibacterium sp. TaxID=2860237 RepID=UPI003AFFF67B
MDDGFYAVLIVSILFVGLPWLFLHYSSKFKAAKGISTQDEQLMDDLYSTARRLDARLESIERIIAAENPQWKDHALPHQRDAQLTDKHSR